MDIITQGKEDTKINLIFLSNKNLIKQILKLLAIIKYLINSGKNETITIKINNVYNSKLSIGINEEQLLDIPNNKKEIILGE